MLLAIIQTLLLLALLGLAYGVLCLAAVLGEWAISGLLWLLHKMTR